MKKATRITTQLRSNHSAVPEAGERVAGNPVVDNDVGSRPLGSSVWTGFEPFGGAESIPTRILRFQGFNALGNIAIIDIVGVDFHEVIERRLPVAGSFKSGGYLIVHGQPRFFIYQG